MSFFSLAASSTPSPPTLLRPQMKPSTDGLPGPEPGGFDTKMGRLLVPREPDPPEPTSDMVINALQGDLTNFFRDGRIFCASDLVGSVSEKSAKISLEDTHDFQTRPLPGGPAIAESAKSLRNLHYIALHKGELPSFHFWTTPGNPDPTTKTIPTNWDEMLAKSRPQGWSNKEQDTDDNLDYLFEEQDSIAHTAIQDTEQEEETTATAPTGTSGGPSTNFSSLTWLHSQKEKAASPKVTENNPRPAKSTGSAFYLPGLDGISPKTVSYPQPEGVTKDSSSSVQIRRPSIFPTAWNIASPSFGQQGLGGNDSSSRKGSMPVVSKTSKEKQQSPFPVLIRCERGGIYVQDNTLRSFKTVIQHLIHKEEDEIFVVGGPKYFDVLHTETKEQTAHQLRTGRDGDLQYEKEFKPILGRGDLRFRKRPEIIKENSPWDNRRSSSIKVTRVGIGYCYMDAHGRWDAASGSEDYQANNERLKSALEFLFMESPPSALTLEIRPGNGIYNFDLNSASPLSSELCKILEEISHNGPIRNGELDPISWVFADEIFVYETGTKFVHPLTLTATESSPTNKPDEADEARETSHNQIEDTGKAGISNQPQALRRFSTIAPQTIFESHPGPYASSRRPSRTPSEIADLERRIGELEQMRDYQGKRIGDLFRGRYDQEQRAEAAEENLREVEQQNSQMQRRQAELDVQLRNVTQERDDLFNRTLIQERDQQHQHTSSQQNEHGKTATNSHSTVGNPRSSHDNMTTQPAPEQDTTAAALGESTKRPGPNKLLYCPECLTSMNTKKEKDTTAHAVKCGTKVESFIYLTAQEAKERRASKKERKKATAPAADTAPKRGRSARTAKVDDQSTAGPSKQIDDTNEDEEAAPKVTKGRHKRALELTDDEADEEQRVRKSKRKVKATTKAEISAPKTGKEPDKGSQPAPGTSKGRNKRTRETAGDEADKEADEEPLAKRPKRAVKATTKAEGSAPKKGKGSGQKGK